MFRVFFASEYINYQKTFIIYEIFEESVRTNQQYELLL